MPIYEIECHNCRLQFEVIEPVGFDCSDAQCPFCHNKALKKNVGLSSFRLKGEGWAKDNYSKKGK